MANDGTILVFAEGRTNSAADNGDVDVVLLRSRDGGATWGPVQVIAEAGVDLAANPAPVVDRRTGDVVLLTTRNPVDHYHQRSIWLQRSSDSGLTWSDPIDVSAEVRGEGWEWLASGPGHGIQIANGPAAGRLVVPGVHDRPGGPRGRLSGFHLMLSDDGGAHWRVGATTDDTDWFRPSEGSIALLPDGRLLVNVRDQDGRSSATRFTGTSSDAGESFDAPLAEDGALVSPVVHGSSLALPDGSVIFTSPAMPSERRRLQVRVRPRDGIWAAGPVLWGTFAGYSDMAIDSTDVLITFEAGYSTFRDSIRLARVPTSAFAEPARTRLRFEGELTRNSESLPALVDRGPLRIRSRADGVESVAEGPCGRAIRFVGGADSDVRWLAGSAAGLLALDPEETATVELTFRTASTACATLARTEGEGPTSWAVELDAGYLRFSVGAEAGTTASVTSTVPVGDGRWHEVRATRDAERGWLLLDVDGRRVGAALDSVRGPVVGIRSQDVRMGRRSDGTCPFAGDVARVAIVTSPREIP